MAYVIRLYACCFIFSPGSGFLVLRKSNLKFQYDYEKNRMQGK